MDFSSLSSAEQAHMTKVIEKKQVSEDCILGRNMPNILLFPQSICHLISDARLHEDVLKPRRTLFHLMLQRLHKQGTVVKRG